jgi:hypothetical protein
MYVTVGANGEKICYETFTIRDIVSFLSVKFNISEKRFACPRELFIPDFSRVFSQVDVSFDGLPITIHTYSSTRFDLCIRIEDKDALSDVVKAFKNWDKFSNNKEKFLCEYDNFKNNTHTIIFESGINSMDYYKSFYKDFFPVLTRF